MKNYKLHLSPQIERDLSEIVFYMQELSTYESNISKFLDRIYSAFEFLQATPLLGQSLENKIDAPTGMRFYIVSQHVIFYEIVGDVIEITRIISEKKDYIRILDLKEPGNE